MPSPDGAGTATVKRVGNSEDPIGAGARFYVEKQFPLMGKMSMTWVLALCKMS
jgi:hypothetical protein